MRKITILWITICLGNQLFAQQHFKFTDGHQLALKGRAYQNDTNYNRLDSLKSVPLPRRVQELAQNSAGLNINFESDAKTIKIDWELAKFVNLSNMTPLAINGLDLYALKDSAWQYVASAMPRGLKNSVVLIDHLDGKARKYRLYLPLYSKLNKLQVGVPSLSYIKADTNAFNNKRKIVIYGSSITQGASASRPGMAYPSIISRMLNIETINLGFSGSGKMEFEMAKILAEIPADVYVLDCVPNPSPQQIRERSLPFIQYLRGKKPQTPIIMIESVYRESANWDGKIKEMVTQQNMEFRKTFEKLKTENPKNLYYITTDKLTGTDHETSIDGTHLTDLGFLRFADALVPCLKKALLLL